jgi:hypothetical protein
MIGVTVALGAVAVRGGRYYRGYGGYRGYGVGAAAVGAAAVGALRPGPIAAAATTPTATTFAPAGTVRTEPRDAVGLRKEPKTSCDGAGDGAVVHVDERVT